MQRMINWWCDFVGITDPEAINVATGVFGGGLALAGVLVVWLLLVALLKYIADRD